MSDKRPAGSKNASNRAPKTSSSKTSVVGLDDCPADDSGLNSHLGDTANLEQQKNLKAEVAMTMFETQLAQVRRRELERQASRGLWLSHHWPDQHATKCVKIGRRHVCRRCAALYPVGFLTAGLSVLGMPLWPATLDPMMIWLLCLPATVAFVGEAIGVFKYSPRWQVATMLVASLAFGKALSYELTHRWSPEFWWPIAIFGGLWFLASVFSAKTAPLRPPQYRQASR